MPSWAGSRRAGSPGRKIGPDGDIAIAANTGDGAVSFIDTSTLEVVETVAVGKAPHAVVFWPRDGRAWETLQGAGGDSGHRREVAAQGR